MNMTLADEGALAPDRAAPGLLGLAERGLLPDSLIRAGIRRLCEKRLAECNRGDVEARQYRHRALIEQLRGAPVAVHCQLLPLHAWRPAIGLLKFEEIVSV